MPDPYLEDVLKAQADQMAANAQETQREHLLYVQKLRAEQLAEQSHMRVDRFVDEFDRYTGASGALTGAEARQRISENAAHNRNLHRAAVTADQTAKNQLTPIQAQVSRLLGIGYETAVSIVAGDPDVANAVASTFQMQVALAEKAKATPLRHKRKETDPQAKRITKRSGKAA